MVWLNLRNIWQVEIGMDEYVAPRVWTLGGRGYGGWESETILGSAPPRRNESIRVIELEPVIDLLDRLCLGSGGTRDLGAAIYEGKHIVLTYGKIHV